MLIPGHEISVRDGTQAIYNGFDCALTFEVNEARQGLRTNDTLIYDFERAMCAPALEMMLRGFRVDIETREREIINTKNRRDSVNQLISILLDAVRFPHTAKLTGSQKQLQSLFYDCMKLKPIERWDVQSGEIKRPMTRDVLEKLETQDRFASPLINAILFSRDMTKTLQVLETEITDHTEPGSHNLNWRWHCSYNIGGTSTGRWSSSKSPFQEFNKESKTWVQSGSNFQNLTEELRRIFIPDPGFKLYGIDKAQSEARDVGWFCGITFGDWSYLDAAESGDLHTAVTRMLYPEWSWTGNLEKDKQIANRKFHRFDSYRQASKKLGHATNYFGKAREISRQTRIPLNLVEEFQTRYFAAFPCIQKMHNWVAENLQRYRYLVNSFGRRRDFFGHPKSDETLKSAIAYMFQSATGDCLNLGLYRLWKTMGREIQILSQLHDAVYFQAPIPANDNIEQEMLKRAINCIEVEQFDPKSGRRMKIPGEVITGYNWAHRFRLLEDGTPDDWNPNGLDTVRII